MPTTPKKLRLEGGQFKRDGKDDDTPVTTPDQYRERAAACLEEAARSQHPNSEAYIRQAEVWMKLAGEVTTT